MDALRGNKEEKKDGERERERERERVKYQTSFEKPHSSQFFFLPFHLPKSSNRHFALASHLLGSVLGTPGIVGGCVIHRQRCGSEHIHTQKKRKDTSQH